MDRIAHITVTIALVGGGTKELAFEADDFDAYSERGLSEGQLPVPVENALVRGVQQALRLNAAPQSDQRILSATAALVSEALTTDGAHHKQWYLELMADLLGVANEHEGIAP